MSNRADLRVERLAKRVWTTDKRITGMFSVIIPVFNGEQLLPRAVKSVFDQTYQNLEVIIVDDGSTDESLPVARSLSSTDSRVHVYAIENSGGPARPRNYGIARAKGEFIAFLDQDDWWLADKLEQQLRMFRAGDYAVVYSDCLYVDPVSPENGMLISELPEVRRRFSAVDGYLPEGQVQRHLIMGNFAAQVTVVVRADWIQKLGGMDETLIGVDCYEHLLRVALAGGNFGVVRSPLAVHERGFLSRDQEVACAHTLRFFRRYARRYREYQGQWALRIREYECALARLRGKAFLDTSLSVSRRFQALSAALWLIARASDRPLIVGCLRQEIMRRLRDRSPAAVAGHNR